jgi:hypothetical protein
MKSINYLLLLIISIVLVSCSGKSELEKKLNCSANLDYIDFKESVDFKNTFKLNVPNKFSEQLFYNNYQTTIMVADTTKSLTNSYMLEINYNSGNLVIEDKLKYDLASKLLKEEQLEVFQDGVTKINKKDAFWLKAKNEKGKYPYHQFLLLIKDTSTNYFEVKTKVYGEENVEERICESVAIIKSLEKIKN